MGKQNSVNPDSSNGIAAASPRSPIFCILNSSLMSANPPGFDSRRNEFETLPAMKVLYATLRPPFPPRMGDALIAWEQIRRLGGEVEITLLTLDERLKDEMVFRQQLEPFCRAIHVLHRRRNHRWIWRSLSKGLPTLVTRFHDRRLQGAIEEVVRQTRPDVIHVQTVHMAEYFKDVDAPKVLDLIDVMSLSMERRATRERFPFGLALEREARALRRYEAAIMHYYDRVTLVSSADALHHPECSFRINPNGVRVPADTALNGQRQQKKRALVFHGNMDYAPNVDAVLWFHRDVWRELAQRYPQLQFYIVGYDPRPRIRALHDGRRVIVTGGVDDVTFYLTRCLVGVYPLRITTGMQNKVLDALACGLPCVASPEAIRGTERLRTGEHLLVANEPREWCEAIGRLLEDREFRGSIAAAGEAAIREGYTWESNVERLLEIWQSVTRV
jgi:sugar transferase (PEP-CTERM/EpsH1 system associated)